MTTNTLKVLRDAVEALEYACEHKCDAEYNPCMYQESALELQTLIASLEAQPVGEPKHQYSFELPEGDARKVRAVWVERKINGDTTTHELCIAIYEAEQPKAVPLELCTCWDDTAKRYCARKGKCVQAIAAHGIGGGND